jgi:hypothetical protein
VKLLPATPTAVCRTKLLLGSVTQGTTEVVVRPFSEKVWLTVELLPLMATITNVVGDELELFLYAVTVTPAEGTAVAPIR